MTNFEVIINQTGLIVVEVDNGIKGEPGVPGPAGPGVPDGGLENQALVKIDSVDYNTEWATIDKSFVGLSLVDNTADIDKPISNATQTALDDKEDLSNKSTDTNLGTSDTLYPSQKAVKDYVDAAITTATIPDATTLVKGKLRLAGDLSGTADLPTVPGLANKFNVPTGLPSDYLDGTGAPTPFPDIVDPAEFDAYNLLQKEPTGFENRTDSVTSFDKTTRIFTIAPTGASFDVYVKGEKYTKTTPQTVTIPNLPGSHYIFFNFAGNLNSTQVAGSELFQDNALVAIIYWNDQISDQVYFAEERHGVVMDGATHSYLHTVFGARFISGHALQDFSVDGTGNLATDAQFQADSGTIRDEDLILQSPAQAQIPVLYKQGNLWRKKAADSFPVIYSGSAGYTGLNGRLPYNALNAGVWSLSEVPNNQFVLVHFFATNDVNNPVVGIQGINTYNSISGARTGATVEIGSLSGLPFAEFVAIGSVIFETATGYLNTPKAKVRSTDTGANYVDFRGTQSFTPSLGQASSHSLLSNLSSDDHLQYLTEARGDARYYTKSQIDDFLDDVAVLKTEIFTLSVTNISEKKIQLSQSPRLDGFIQFIPDGGIVQRIDVDFAVSGNDILWAGLTLDGFLEVGEVIRITYQV